MSTVRSVIERVYREALFPADDQPTRAPLSAALTDSATTVTWDSTLLSPEEQDLYAEGIVVEVDREQMLVTDVNASTGALTVTRGYAGTTAAAHASGALLYAAPAYSRQAVFDAVCDNVVALYPTLYRLRTETVVSQSTPLDVPADVVVPVGLTYEASTGVYTQGTVSLLAPFPASATGKAITFHGMASGRTGYFTYRARFTRPTSEDDELADLGVEQWWERIIVVGAAAQVIGGRELDATTQEFLAEQLRAQGFPVGSTSRVRAELLRVYEVMLEQARRNQIAQHAEVVSFAQPDVSWGAW